MRLQCVGYSRLGLAHSDGVRYVWTLGGKTPYVESAAFRTRAKIPTSTLDTQICAYTTSVSSGCALTPARLACKFCRTGNTLRFSGPLSAREIALQNVFMVLSDMEEAPDGPASGNLREFAYMGQGEPGFAYTQLREAIRLTDKAMRALDQKVFRHILATCGVVEMVDAVCDDLENDFFEGTRITFHYSLHATQQRRVIMPIETVYAHTEIIRRLPNVFALTGEKPCVGVLLFKNYCKDGGPEGYSTDDAEIDRIAALLDPDICRISLCEFNPCDTVGTNAEVRPDEASGLVKKLEARGFEVKLFASFGKQENTACGLLGGTAPDRKTDAAMRERYVRAKTLIDA